MRNRTRVEESEKSAEGTDEPNATPPSLQDRRNTCRREARRPFENIKSKKDVMKRKETKEGSARFVAARALGSPDQLVGGSGKPRWRGTR
jgi:hypothetical protein